MKKNLVLLFAISIVMLVGIGLAVPTQDRQQPGTRPRTIETVDLDSTIAPLTGKRVMYQLTDEEGGLDLDDLGQSRKVPAEITYNYRGRRDTHGHLLSPLFIKRPGFLGGPFSKDEVRSNPERTPGTWDNLQPGDLRN